MPMMAPALTHEAAVHGGRTMTEAARITKAVPASVSSSFSPEESPLPWDYQEEPDLVPSKKPTAVTPVPNPTVPRQPMPWDYQEELDIEGGEA
jgi:hypothetical protein